MQAILAKLLAGALPTLIASLTASFGGVNGKLLVETAATAVQAKKDDIFTDTLSNDIATPILAWLVDQAASTSSSVVPSSPVMIPPQSQVTV